MSNSSAIQTVEQRRQRVVDILSESYAQGALGEEEFERRVERAAGTEDADELERLLDGLVTRETALASRTGSIALVASEDVPDKRTLLAFFGPANRARDWSVPRLLRVYAVLGGSELDFREARLGPGTTEVRVTAVLGGVQIIVPPGLPVEVDGTGILGGFEDRGHLGATDSTFPARLRITGIAVLGGVEVEERLPGESPADARRRRGNP